MNIPLEIEVIGDGKKVATPVPVAPVRKEVRQQVKAIETSKESAASALVKEVETPAVALEGGELDGRQAQNAKEIFMRELRREVERRKIYPLLAKRQQLQGQVLLLLKVLEDGRFEKVELVKSSSAEILDHAAQQLVANLSGKIQMASAGPSGAFEILVPIEYVLKK